MGAIVTGPAAGTGDRTGDLSHNTQTCYHCHQRAKPAGERSNLSNQSYTPYHILPHSNHCSSPSTIQPVLLGSGHPALAATFPFLYHGDRRSASLPLTTAIPGLTGVPFPGAIVTGPTVGAGDRTLNLSRKTQTCYHCHQRAKPAGESSNLSNQANTPCHSTSIFSIHIFHYTIHMVHV